MPKILYTRHRRILRQLLDALIRRKLPVGPDAPDADTPDAFYQHLHKLIEDIRLHLHVVFMQPYALSIHTKKLAVSHNSGTGCFLPSFPVSSLRLCALITQSAAAIDRTIDSTRLSMAVCTFHFDRLHAGVREDACVWHAVSCS